MNLIDTDSCLQGPGFESERTCHVSHMPQNPIWFLINIVLIIWLEYVSVT